MYAITDFLQSMGTTLLQPFWFPVVIWTIVAIPITLLLRKRDALQPVYQYHSRVALLLALPLGILGSYGIEILGEVLASSEATTAKFIVIQNPITVAAAQSTPTFWQSISHPMLWIGLSSTLLIMGAVYYLLRLGINVIQLKKIGQKLTFETLTQLNEQYIPSDDKKLQHINPLIAFSEQASVPFTYGWINTRIVIPAELKHDPEKTAMAIRHELMHIRHKDFLLNGVLMIVKALFWFHPLSHYLYRSSQEYREITCDGQVLADTQFSKKQYANLLFELAEREYQNSNLAMSMAVNPSSLKKRIQIMSTQNISTTTFRSSFLLTLATAALVVLTISCSDLNSEDGITNTEFQEAQAQMTKQSNNNIPLYIINGEQMNSTEENTIKLARIKSKYIKSVSVLKEQDAIDAYGNAGKGGVIKINFIDGIAEETIYSDLKEKPGKGSVVPPPPPQSKEDFYVAVEQMPELIGRLAGLQKKINYPQKAKEEGIDGRVIIKFIVNEQGDVEDPKIIRGVGGGLDEEALRVVKQAKFKPGKQSGKAVRVQYSLPIVYKLPSTISKKEPKVDLETPKVDNAEMSLQNVQTSDNGTVSGKIISAKNNAPLPGANVIITGTNKGSSTDQNGEFSIQGLSQGTHNLTISYIGYQPSKGTITIE